MTAPSPQDTKQRLLDAAERLFARRGSPGTSLRAVTAAASTNVAAVHYHFGGKQQLLRAVVERRVGPANQERLKRLEQILAGPDGPPDVEEILRAFLVPVMNPDAVSAIRDVSGLLFREPDENMRPLVGEVFGEVGRAFTAALGDALPKLSAPEVQARFQLGVGVMVHVISGRFEMGLAVHGQAAPPHAGALEAVVAFLAAGLRAPAAARAGAG